MTGEDTRQRRSQWLVCSGMVCPVQAVLIETGSSYHWKTVPTLCKRKTGLFFVDLQMPWSSLFFPNTNTSLTSGPLHMLSSLPGTVSGMFSWLLLMFPHPLPGCHWPPYWKGNCPWLCFCPSHSSQSQSEWQTYFWLTFFFSFLSFFPFFFFF